MKNPLLARGLFWGAALVSLLLYALTAPEGLPWNPSTHWAAVFTDAVAKGEAPTGASLPLAIWGRFVVAFAGHHVALASVAAAFAAGWVAVLAFRFFGWRVAVGLALAWTFSPWVWNRAVTGSWNVCLASGVVFTVWILTCIGHRLLRKARAARRVTPAATTGAPLAAPSGHSAVWKWMRQGKRVSWVVLGVGVLMALVMPMTHDYLIGEPASVYARGIVEEAAGRIVVLNGVADEQVVAEVKAKGRGEGEEIATLSLVDRSSDYLESMVEQVKNGFPGDTNLWTAARIGAAAFADAGVKMHPERFYAMDGRSTTLAGWERRWEAFKPSLRSRDPFVSVGRRAFAYEGNAVANGLLDATGGFPSAVAMTNANAHLAWRTYQRIHAEVDSGNISALVNMSEMIRLGYPVSGDEKRQLQDAIDRFFKDKFKRRHARAIVRSSGPIRMDLSLLAQVEAEAKKRLVEKVASGEEQGVPPDILRLVEWNNMMISLLEQGEAERAGRIARKILSNEKWRGHVPANAVMGIVSSMEGDYLASSSFFTAATNTTEKIPSPTLNDFADMLLKYGRTDEAETLARRAVAEGGKEYWVAHLTLAEILARKVMLKSKAEVDLSALRAEMRSLLKEVMVQCPANMRGKVRERVEQIRRESTK